MPFSKIIKALEKHGWDIVRYKGSHVRFKNRYTKQKTTIARRNGAYDTSKITKLSKQFNIKIKVTR
ncbi:type II toxin-antitoxin system HicA family toxin [Priestia megaterium]|uniref:type II toxin-antitoxin system HicA family toxin n=1 Tax=Priestia megaterium TaxID=1404 RepID=UPI0039C20CEE